MRKTPIIAALLGAGILLPLVGCTNSDTAADKTTAPTSKPSASATTPPKSEDVANKCIDGFASIVGDGKDIELPDGCPTVSVVTDGSTVTLGAVDKLLVESSNTTIHVAGVKEVQAVGDKNTIDYTGDAPTIDDKGKENVVTAK
jgi:hypothetical protein